jgi:stage II sporulation protein D
MRRALAFVYCLLFLLNPKASASDTPYYSDRAEKAVKYYEDKIKDNKDDKINYFDLASVYKELGENRKAFELYREVLTQNETETRAHFELAKMYYFLGAYNYAEEEIEYFIRRGNVNWEVYYWLGCILKEQGRYEEARAAFNKSVDADGKKVITYLKLAELNRDAGNLDRAIAYYKTAIKKDRTYTEEITRKLAVLNEKKGNFVEAYKDWREAGDIDTKDGVAAGKAQQFLAYLPNVKTKLENYKHERQHQRNEYLPPDKLPVEGAGKIPAVEVGIMEDVNYIYFKSGSEFQVLDENKKLVFNGSSSKEYFIDSDKDGRRAYIGPVDGSAKPAVFKKKVFIIKDRQEATTAVYNVQYGEGFYWSEKTDTTYRGDFKVVLEHNALTLVNILNIEEYLYGVVPSEMPPSWNKEALKAQTVAARTYTFKHMDRHRADDFDVCAQQHCAVYKGVYGESEKTDRAVDETRGEVLSGSDYYMLDTFYSHCCGGHTTDINEAWGMKPIKSLEGVFDGRSQTFGQAQAWAFPLEPYYLEEWVRTLPDVYCRATGDNETSFRWIRYLDADTLEYYVNRRYKIGRIKDIKPVKRAKSGALVKMYIEGDKGRETVNFDSMRNILGQIRSNVIKWEYCRDAKGYIKDIYIYGAGWGHDIGMCQRGANGMAGNGSGYYEILYHYYPGSYIKKKY